MVPFGTLFVHRYRSKDNTTKGFLKADVMSSQQLPIQSGRIGCDDITSLKTVEIHSFLNLEIYGLLWKHRSNPSLPNGFYKFSELLSWKT